MSRARTMASARGRPALMSMPMVWLERQRQASTLGFPRRGILRAYLWTMSRTAGWWRIQMSPTKKATTPMPMAAKWAAMNSLAAMTNLVVAGGGGVGGGRAGG